MKGVDSKWEVYGLDLRMLIMYSPVENRTNTQRATPEVIRIVLIDAEYQVVKNEQYSTPYAQEYR